MRPNIVRNLEASERDVRVGPWSDDERARRYDSVENRLFYQALLGGLVAGAGPFSRGRGLDLGCGTGFATEGLLQAFPDVAWQGVDVSAPMLARAADKPGLAAVSLRHAAAEALPYAAGSFDVVVSNFSWHWFRPAAADEVLRVLRPGGWLLVSAPVRHFSRAQGNRWLARGLHADRRNFRRLTSQGLRIEDMASLLPGEMRTHRLESVAIEERFADASALLATLESRGSLHAIFGHEGVEAASRVGSLPTPPAGASGRTAIPPAPRASRAPSSPAPRVAHHRGRDGEAEREGASEASGCGGEGAGPEVPAGGSERGGGGRWGAEGRSEPFEGSHISDTSLAFEWHVGLLHAQVKP
jgi:SAM-dependent methyltransferase